MISSPFTSRAPILALLAPIRCSHAPLPAPQLDETMMQMCYCDASTNPSTSRVCKRYAKALQPQWLDITRPQTPLLTDIRCSRSSGCYSPNLKQEHGHKLPQSSASDFFAERYCLLELPHPSFEVRCSATRMRAVREMPAPVYVSAVTQRTARTESVLDSTSKACRDETSIAGKTERIEPSFFI